MDWFEFVGICMDFSGFTSIWIELCIFVWMHVASCVDCADVHDLVRICVVMCPFRGVVQIGVSLDWCRFMRSSLFLPRIFFFSLLVWY